MKLINVEIKAICKNLGRIRKVLEEENARFKGIDHQIDTYFNTDNGRLKLRQGNIENFLISYHRKDKTEAKLSNVILYDTTKQGHVLKELLTKHYGIKCVIDKKREIYYIKNIKIHLDQVKELGTFVEIEAKSDKKIDEERLRKQVEYYMEKFGIEKEDLVKVSYSDMLLKNRR